MTEPSNDRADYPAPITPYVPTTDQVKGAYIRGMRNAFIGSAGEHAAEFDRWLQQVQADAWDEAHHATGRWAMGLMRLNDMPDNPYRRQKNDDE
jgi:hypothetical protein